MVTKQQNPAPVRQPDAHQPVAAPVERFEYDNAVVHKFAVATTVWGVVGMLVGLLAAMQLTNSYWNFEQPYLTFSRIRPLHTNAVIFAFVGNGMFAGIYYSLQRLCKARLFSDFLSNFHFWGWQLIIVSAALTLPFGITSSKEYAELEWPIDIAITVVWVAFGVNMIGTMIRRRESHFYVAIWFYVATFVTVAVLHLFNNLEVPVTWVKSYPVYAGVQDALVQWWYGHNAVAFFLTTPYLGLMYYFVPKAAGRPVYSYRLSIIHFWALIFIYIWAGPHHLLYTALPDWAQSLGTVFSLMLIAPSWGGMLNGLLTLRGAWDKVRTDPILKFFVVAVTAYGMATFEGPMMSIKTVNAISHFTDWTIAHVHVGGLGWNGFLTFGMLYWLVPRLFGTKLHSVKLAEAHFWIGTLGIIFYAVPLYWAGWVQALMWREFRPDGFLQYPNFLETVVQILPMYMARVIGGALYLTGALMMVYNLFATMAGGKLVKNEAASAPALPKDHNKKHHGHWHRWIESRPIQLTVFSTVAIAIGGLIEIVPTIMVKSNTPTIRAVKPYTPLELQGRDIYVEEGCYTCHSQMIRPFRHETLRYGDYSKAGEFIYDRPFQWGSKRTGPDLHRIGGRYGDDWHWRHLYDPQQTSDGSIMPSYHWLAKQPLDTTTTGAKIRVMTSLGVPYPRDYDKVANKDLEIQAAAFAARLREQGISEPRGSDVPVEATKMTALIAYLQRLGTDIKNAENLPNK